MKLLYITYIDFDGKGKSGSSVRPQKMYKAFLQMGLDVKLLECQQNKFKERRKRVKEILHWLDNNTPDLCYIESPSGPIFNQIDLKLIKKVHDMGVPIGYFLRDAFWKFPVLQKNIPFVKKEIINAMCKRDLHLLMKNCDIIYFPTKSFAQLFNLKKINHWDALPPAAEMITKKNVGSNNAPTCIYVGGVSLFYGTDILIDAFKLLNETDTRYNLILVCRTEDYKKLFLKPIEYEWLKIVHTSGENLKQYYDLADVGIIPIRKADYSNIGMSVKLFEYLGNGLPIISTSTKEMSNFIRQNKVGLICEDNAESLADTIKAFLNGDTQVFLDNVHETIKKNTWDCRAKKVVNDLLDIHKK